MMFTSLVISAFLPAMTAGMRRDRGHPRRRSNHSAPGGSKPIGRVREQVRRARSSWDADEYARMTCSDQIRKFNDSVQKAYDEKLNSSCQTLIGIGADIVNGTLLCLDRYVKWYEAAAEDEILSKEDHAKSIKEMLDTMLNTFCDYEILSHKNKPTGINALISEIQEFSHHMTAVVLLIGFPSVGKLAKYYSPVYANFQTAMDYATQQMLLCKDVDTARLKLRANVMLNKLRTAAKEYTAAGLEQIELCAASKSIRTANIRDKIRALRKIFNVFHNKQKASNTPINIDTMLSAIDAFSAHMARPGNASQLS